MTSLIATSSEPTGMSLPTSLRTILLPLPGHPLECRRRRTERKRRGRGRSSGERRRYLGGERGPGSRKSLRQKLRQRGRKSLLRLLATLLRLSPSSGAPGRPEAVTEGPMIGSFLRRQPAGSSAPARRGRQRHPQEKPSKACALLGKGIRHLQLGRDMKLLQLGRDLKLLQLVRWRRMELGGSRGHLQQRSSMRLRHRRMLTEARR
mmetsp:Transcript_17103/g.56679  ORF Transcript_17103/g.56679 Transcript_17103/m.56679 type:complete len:206 (+) Transcript_17103:1131-1748(+)